jgi:hypothetical protein
MLVDEGLELLSDEQCWRLLSSGEVGRVAITMHALPAIFPVNYTVIDGTIVFLTSPGSKLAAAIRQAVVAFEVDDYERTDRTGVGASWSSGDPRSSTISTSRARSPPPAWNRGPTATAPTSYASHRASCPVARSSTPHGRTASIADPQPAPRTGDHRSAPEKPPTER